jgi:hypothetical protein
MPEITYIVEQTAKTPFINLNGQTGVFELTGRSLPENPVQFYLPMFIWLENYFLHPVPQTILNIQLDYFNTNSAKCIVELFKKLEEHSKTGKSNAIINWRYFDHDEDMMETGEDFKSIVDIQFNIVSFVK